ncbi:MAG: 4Fe-4S binding protein [Myxococcota bacterium]
MDQQGQNGLMTTFRSSVRMRGAGAWVIFILLAGFYCLLYFPGTVENVPDVITPIAEAIGLRNKWFFYGLLYSVAVTVGAVFYLRKHGNSAYNRKRMAVNVTMQCLLAFTLPLVMPYFLTDDPDEYGRYESYANYFWPLAWYDFHPSTLESKAPAIAAWSLGGALVLSPVMAVVFGKRWYCSWVCGCGALANTFGDPWRHLTSKSTKSWRFEKVAVHTVLVLALVSTILIIIDHYYGSDMPTLRKWVAGEGWTVKKTYGFVVGSILAGVVGTGLYPLLGPRVWCRNFCPMAAMLGLLQKLGRFHIRVKKDMCISCGNCTTYCEMGIDVRAYAQKNESFTRASCVGCGMCAHVCPRGVLKLENDRLAHKPEKKSLPVVS